MVASQSTQVALPEECPVLRLSQGPDAVVVALVDAIPSPSPSDMGQEVESAVASKYLLGPSQGRSSQGEEGAPSAGRRFVQEPSAEEVAKAEAEWNQLEIYRQQSSSDSHASSLLVPPIGGEFVPLPVNDDRAVVVWTVFLFSSTGEGDVAPGRLREEGSALSPVSWNESLQYFVDRVYSVEEVFFFFCAGFLSRNGWLVSVSSMVLSVVCVFLHWCSNKFPVQMPSVASSVSCFATYVDLPG